MRQILLGTTNPAKADYFTRILEGYDVSFLTLRDLDIRNIPDEAGSSPLENARAKAACYGQFWDYVLTQDAALYIRELALDDPRQPGLTVRRRSDGHVMTDEEAIAHYAGLAHELGGRMTCWYQEGYAVANHGKVTGFMDDGPINDIYRFYMVDKPYPSYMPGCLWTASLSGPLRASTSWRTGSVTSPRWIRCWPKILPRPGGASWWRAWN